MSGPAIVGRDAVLAALGRDTFIEVGGLTT
jgi:hypothetical protein